MGRPPPLPLRSGSGPVPVESVGLEYAGWGVRVHSRPGVLVALGVVSIVVGVLGIAANVLTMVGARQLHAWSEPAPAAPQAPWPAVALVPHLGDFVGERGLKSAQRQAVLSAVVKRRAVLADRREMLERLLADVGGEVFPGLGQGGEAEAAKLIKEVTWKAEGPDGAGMGTDVLRTAGGAVEVTNQEAKFVAASGWTARVKFNHYIEQGRPVRWGALATDWAIDKAHERMPELNAIQAAAIIREVRGLTPKTWNDWPLPNVQLYKVLQAGTIHGSVEEGKGFWVLADGRLVYPPVQMNWGTTWDPSTGAPRPKSSGRLHLPISRWATRVLVADAYLGFGVAALVIVCGIGALAEARWAGELHRIYAAVKLLVVGLTLTASLVLVAQWEEAAAVAGRGGMFVQSAGQMLTATLVGVLVWVAYPIAVLLVLRAARVRAYYARLGASRWLMPHGVGSWARRMSKGWVVMGCAAGVLVVGNVVLLVKDARVGEAGVIVWAVGAVACLVVVGLSGWWSKMGRRGGVVAVGVLVLVMGGGEAVGQTPRRGSGRSATTRAVGPGAGRAPAAAPAKPFEEVAREARSSDAKVRQGALWALTRGYGEAGDAEVLRLVEETKDAAALRDVMEIAAKGGPAGAMAVLRVVGSAADEEVRKDAVRALSHCVEGPRDLRRPENARTIEAALPHLVRIALTDRMQAASAAYFFLANRLGLKGDVTPHVLPYLGHANATVRKTAAGLAMAIWEGSDELHAAAVGLLADKDAEVRGWAGRWLMNRGGERGRAAVEGALGHAEARVRVTAIEWAFANVQQVSAEQAGRLGRIMMTDGERDVRRAAALRMRNAWSAAAMGVFVEAVKTGSPEVRELAVEMIVGGKATVAAVLPLLEDGDPKVRAAAVRILGDRVGEGDRPLERVVRMTEDRDEGVSRAALMCLQGWWQRGPVTERRLNEARGGGGRSVEGMKTSAVAWMVPAGVARGPAVDREWVRVLVGVGTVVLVVVMGVMGAARGAGREVVDAVVLE